MEGQQLLRKAIYSCHFIKSIFEFLGSVSNFKNVSKWHLELQEWKKNQRVYFNDKMTRMFVLDGERVLSLVPATSTTRC